MSLCIFLFFTSIFNLCWIDVKSECALEQQLDKIDEWMKIFPSGYKQNAPPKDQDYLTKVKLLIKPMGIPEMSIEKMYLKVDVIMYFFWSDCRLSLPQFKKRTALPDEISKLVWHPGIFFANSLGAEPIRYTGEIHTMKIMPNQELNYAKRAIIPFYCEFDLSSYPMDIQRCELQILPIDDLEIEKPTTTEVATLLKGRTPPYFVVRNVTRGNCSEFGGSCTALIIILERSVPYYLMVIYFPSMLIVILTWLSFWLDVEATAPRITLGLTSLLTLATQFANAQRALPPVSYVKAIDVWMFVCMVSVFASLVEFAIANHLHRRDINGNPFQRAKVRVLNVQAVVSNAAQIRNVQTPKTEGLNAVTPKKTNFIDGISRKLFPITFLLFNVVYWCYYLISKHYLTKKLDSQF